MSDTEKKETPVPEVVETPAVADKPKPKRKAAARKGVALKHPQKRSNLKGGAWERNVGKMLSLWVTQGERGDIFRRSILSGGRFTQETAKGRQAIQPGDIAMAHPLAAGFIASFCVEAKHVRDVNLLPYLLGDGNPFLKKVITKVKSEAESSNTDWMVIARQNRMPTMLLISQEIAIIAAAAASHKFTMHILFWRGDSIALMCLDDFLAAVPASTFLQNVGAVAKVQPPKFLQRRQITPPTVQRRQIHAGA